MSQHNKDERWKKIDSAFFTVAASQVAERSGVDPGRGLSEQDAKKRLGEHGPNRLKQERRVSLGQILWRQFTEPLVLVLVAAATISLVVWLMREQGEPLPYDTIIIMAIVLLNTALGFFQEFRTERAVEKLKEMSAPECQVRRDGQVKTIRATEVVPGEVLVLESGDRVPADARLIESSGIEADESALTGESTPVEKQTQPIEDLHAEVAERKNTVHMGTVITAGHGEAIVVATGRDTQMGSIAEMIEEVGEQQTPLQKELAIVGKQLGLLVLGICVIVAVTGILRAGSLSGDVLLSILLFAVALAVAAIPEGLPAVVTAVLAIGVRRMAEGNAIVRRLPAVETLGSATVICSDKTGTLTHNEMTVRKILFGAQHVIEVEGEGYEPEGKFFTEDGEEVSVEDEDLQRLLRMCVLDSNAELVKNEEGYWQIQGDPTEGAPVVTARKAGFKEKELRTKHPRIVEIPFSSERKRMTVLVEIDGERFAYMKGAPDVVLGRCTRVRTDGEEQELTEELRREIEPASRAPDAGEPRAGCRRDRARDDLGRTHRHDRSAA